MARATLHRFLSESMPMTDSNTRLLSVLTGIFLVLVALAFIVLLAVLRYEGQLAGDVRISAFLLGCAAILFWTGYTFLVADPEELRPDRANNLDQFLLTLRPAAELIAASGCLLMLCRTVCTLAGVLWPSGPVFVALLIAPVGIGLFMLRILVPGAFQLSVFRDDPVHTWSANIRLLYNLLVRVGWFGYCGLVLVRPQMDEHIAAPSRHIVQIVAYLLISILYASQFVVLRFGNMRRPEKGHV